MEDEAILQKHAGLFRRYSDLAKKFDLPQPPLRITNYHIPGAYTATDGSIIIDSALLKLVEPDELEGILSHELAHLELKHNVRGNRREMELEADTLGAERAGNPLAISSALNKLEQFQRELRNASFRYKVLEGTGRVAQSIHRAIKGKMGYPPTFERTYYLKNFDQSFSERIKGESEPKESGPEL